VTSPTTGWGAEGWGSDPWGGSLSGSPIVFQGCVAIAENVVRLYFSETPYFSGLLDALDASLLSHYSVAPDPTTQGVDGSAARPVTVLYAEVGGDPDSIDLVLDRPMTPAPSLYSVTVTGIADAATVTPIAAPVTLGFVGCYRRIVPPQLDSPVPSRDFANPQTPASLTGTSPLSPSAIAYGTYVVDDTGDYAFDAGVVAYKKRVLRRGMTRKNGFAHLPGYGVGIPQQGKRLASATLRQQMAADWESQIKQEPETAAVSVTTVTDPSTPSLCFFVVRARMKSGTSVNFKTAHPTG
jgi:hypothetical protein